MTVFVCVFVFCLEINARERKSEYVFGDEGRLLFMNLHNINSVFVFCVGPFFVSGVNVTNAPIYICCKAFCCLVLHRLNNSLIELCKYINIISGLSLTLLLLLFICIVYV